MIKIFHRIEWFLGLVLLQVLVLNHIAQGFCYGEGDVFLLDVALYGPWIFASVPCIYDHGFQLDQLSGLGIGSGRKNQRCNRYYE